MDDFYITGDPLSNSEASLVIAFERHPDIVTDEKHPNYDQGLAKYFKNSAPVIIANFNQVDMKTGTLQRVTRTFWMYNEFQIELSKNVLKDRNNYFGLVHTEPESQTFFSLEQ